MRFEGLAEKLGASGARGRFADLRIAIQSGGDIHSVLIGDDVSVSAGASANAALTLVASPEA